MTNVVVEGGVVVKVLLLGNNRFVLLTMDLTSRGCVIVKFHFLSCNRFDGFDRQAKRRTCGDYWVSRVSRSRAVFPCIADIEPTDRPGQSLLLLFKCLDMKI